jgi:ectoine hydroxylase-related dioxygenase (phytanoyl-CoA dioxygenase family)
MLSPAQVDHYNTEGYTVVGNFLSNEQIAAFIDEMDAASAGNTLAEHDATRMEMEPDQAPDGTQVRRLYEPCSKYERFGEFARSQKLLDAVESLLGPDLVYHYSKINMKPAGVGSVVEWHQDLSYYPLTNRDSVSILFYLDDATIENGCLQIIPRRHRDDLLSHSTDGFFQGRVTETVDESLAVPVPGTAGSVIFMHAMTPHASIANTSTSPRRTLILSYRAADAFPVYTGEMTHKTEVYAQLVRGRFPQTARFEDRSFPIPLYKDAIVSLYDLQERSREGTMAAH